MLGVSFLDQIKKLETLKKLLFKNSLSNFIITFFEQMFRNNWKKNIFRFEENKFLLNFNLIFHQTIFNKNFH